MLRRMLSRFRPSSLIVPEPRPVKPPDFVQLDKSSPVGKYVGVGVAAVTAVFAISLISGPRPSRPGAPPPAVSEKPVAETIRAIPEAKSPISETKAAAVETNPDTLERPAQAAPTAPPAVEQPGRSGSRGTQRKMESTSPGTIGGDPDGDKSNNKRPQKRAD